jgi:hypothetical protein
MAATTLDRPVLRAEGRTRDATVLGRILTAVSSMLPGAGRALARAGSRARSLVLHVGGLGMIVYAAWSVAVPLGALAGGVALLLLEYLSTPKAPGRR